MLMLLLTALYLRFYMACQYIHCCLLNTFPERQVVQKGVGGGGGVRSKHSTSILKVHVSGILLYASLTVFHSN